MATTKKRTAAGVLTGEKWDAMTEAQRRKVIADIEAESPRDRLARSQPLNAERRARWERVKKKMAGRPKLGKHGTRIVSITVEKDLLKRADDFAKAHGLKRSELVVRCLAATIGAA